MEKLVTVRELKPYHIKVNDDYIHIILAYQYFTISIDNAIYKFVPVAAKEIKINRKTKQIQNGNDLFAFQKEKNVIHIGINDLLYNPDFLIQIHSIAEPYYLPDAQTEQASNWNIDTFIKELEERNIKQLIDDALDNNDADTFYELARYLQ